MRRVVARSNFSCNLTGNRPPSLTDHTANVNGSVAGTNTAEEKREDQNIKYLSKSKKDRSFAEKERQPS